jgi:Spy/CpxP family protein refolding chaperone
MRTKYKFPWVLTAAILLLQVVAFAQPTIPPDKEGLLKGQGMGLAEIAEINNYPGPKHTLDLKNELGLTREQLKKTEALEKVVASSALAKGEEIVLAEEELSKLFEAGTISEKALRSKLEEIAKLRADLRFTHLQAHLRMKQILTADQIKRYAELRGHETKHEN